jgi:hypothetical protein
MRVSRYYAFHLTYVRDQVELAPKGHETRSTASGYAAGTLASMAVQGRLIYEIDSIAAGADKSEAQVPLPDMRSQILHMYAGCAIASRSSCGTIGVGAAWPWANNDLTHLYPMNLLDMLAQALAINDDGLATVVHLTRECWARRRGPLGLRC